MGLMTSTISASGFATWICCEDCKAQSSKVESADRTRAILEAQRRAEREGFVAYKDRVWVCPACRIRRLPDKLKCQFPGLCARFGITLPATAAEPPPVPKRTRKKKNQV